MTVEVTATPANPQHGEQMTFTVTVSDPDAQITRDCDVFVSYGDGQGEPACATARACDAQHGPWTPPDPQPDRYETTFAHVYGRNGAFTATFSFESFSTCSDDPYGSNATGELMVRVGS